MRKLDSLQVLRGFAASAVVLGHAMNLKLPSETYKPRFDLGAVGVDVFFVISGVIICLIAQGSPAEFMRRRIWRVVPIYFAVTLLAYPFTKGVQPASLWTTLTFWPAWHTMTMPLLGVGWTLCFEMLFYTCAAITLAHRNAVLLFAAVYGGCMFGLYSSGLTVFQFLGNPIILEFWAGVIIASWWKQGVRVAYPHAIIAAGIVLLILVPNVGTIIDVDRTMSGDTSLTRVLLVGVPAALIVWGFLNLDFRWPKFLVDAGDASYSIYLAHAAALTPFAYVILAPGLRPYSVPFFLGISAIASFFTYQWIEKPILEFARSQRAANRVEAQSMGLEPDASRGS